MMESGQTYSINGSLIQMNSSRIRTYLQAYLDSCRDHVLIAWDIETDTSQPRFIYPNNTESGHPSGLDPRVASVISIAAVDGLNTFLVDAPAYDKTLYAELPRDGERATVDAFTNWIKAQAWSRLVGWNTTYFDVPFLIARGFSDFSVVDDGSNRIPEPKYGYPEWKDLVNRGRSWNNAYIGRTEVWDISHIFKNWAEKNGVKHSLKPVCEALGIEMISVDFEAGQKLTPAEMREYNLSDSTGTWCLAKMIPELADAGEL